MWRASICSPYAGCCLLRLIYTALICVYIQKCSHFLQKRTIFVFRDSIKKCLVCSLISSLCTVYKNSRRPLKPERMGDNLLIVPLLLLVVFVDVVVVIVVVVIIIIQIRPSLWFQKGVTLDTFEKK